MQNLPKKSRVFGQSSSNSTKKRIPWCTIFGYMRVPSGDRRPWLQQLWSPSWPSFYFLSGPSCWGREYGTWVLEWWDFLGSFSPCPFSAWSCSVWPFSPFRLVFGYSLTYSKMSASLTASYRCGVGKRYGLIFPSYPFPLLINWHCRRRKRSRRSLPATSRPRLLLRRQPKEPLPPPHRIRSLRRVQLSAILRPVWKMYRKSNLLFRLLFAWNMRGWSPCYFIHLLFLYIFIFRKTPLYKVWLSEFPMSNLTLPFHSISNPWSLPIVLQWMSISIFQVDRFVGFAHSAICINRSMEQADQDE